MTLNSSPSFFQVALSSSMVKSSTKTAFVVGTLLNIINQSDAIFANASFNVSQVLLTYLVPYFVSTYAGVNAQLKLLKPQTGKLTVEKQDGIIEYAKMGFAGQYAWLMKLGYVIAICLSLLMFYCGFKFFKATPDKQFFWGVLLMLSFTGQVATKLWIYMHTNTNILSREIKSLKSNASK